MELKGKKQFQTGVRWLVWSGLLALVGTGGWLVYVQALNRPGDPVAVRLVTAELDTVETTINESGTVELRGQQTLTSPEESAVEQVLVSVGDRVKAGQPLVTLRNPDRQTILADKQLEIQSKELTLARNQQKITEAEVKLATAQQELKTDQSLGIQKQELILARNREKIVEAQEKLKAEEQKLQDLEALDQRGFIPKNELRSQQEQVRNAHTEVREAQATVGTDVLELQNLQLQNQTTQEERQNKVLDAQAALREAQLAVRTDTRELQRLQLELQKIKQQLQNNVVTAPIDGKVLNIMVKDGDGVDRGKELLTLGDPKQELVSLKLSTLNAAQVQVNQEARVSVIGPNPRVFEGRVQSLSPQATTSESENSNSQSQQATVPATVQLNRPTGTLIPGSQVNVEIILKQRQNVVALQTEAIQRAGTQSFVWVRDAQGKAQKRNVTLGLDGLTTVEIPSGLRPGDKVVLPPPEPPLQEGTPVTPEGQASTP
jgi:HlyD family secretion protein